MSKTSDAGARAADFLKAWQKEMTRQMHDPDMIRAMLAAMQPFGVKQNDEPAQQPAATDDARDAAIRKLERRLDALERELARVASLVPVAAKAQNPTGASKRGRNGSVANRAKPVAKSKRPVAKGAKPAGKPKQKR